MNLHELAWAAGFFDGEGYVGYSLHPKKLSACVAQTNEELLTRFRHAVGGLGQIYRIKVRAAHHRPCWQWRVTRTEHVQAVVALLWRFLGPVKRAQAKTALLTWQTQPDARYHLLPDQVQLIRNSQQTATELHKNLLGIVSRAQISRIKHRKSHKRLNTSALSVPTQSRHS